MNAKGLEIGNIISSKKCSHFRVDEIRLTSHQGYVARMYPFPGTNNPYPLDSWLDLPLRDARPIPITEEILRDWCGFSVNEDGFSCAEFAKSDKGYSLRSFDISSRDGIFFLWVSAEDQWYSSELTGVKYLHQLQNLYFSLTGQELIINIPKQ